MFGGELLFRWFCWNPAEGIVFEGVSIGWNLFQEHLENTSWPIGFGKARRRFPAERIDVAKKFAADSEDIWGLITG